MAVTTAAAFNLETTEHSVAFNFNFNGNAHFAQPFTHLGHLPYGEEELNEETEEIKDRLFKAAKILAVLNSCFEPEVETYSTAYYGDETPLPTRPCYLRYCSLKIPC